MRRAALTTGATVAGVVLLLSLKPHHSPLAAAPPGTGTGGGTASGTPTPGAPRNGTFQGRVADTRYGPVQVEITMSGGRLTAVRVLRTPSENGRDREIAASAVPRLTARALKAGGAHIDAVSGATYTSEGYITSLQSALDRAGA